MNINDFCNKHDYREYFREPFNIGERTIASNGYVLLSVPRCVDNAHGDDLPEKLCETILRMLDDLQAQQFAPLPTDITMPEPNDCPSCKGTGHAKRTECPECEGEGETIAETDHNEYEVLCKTCSGDGFVLSSVGNEDEECENCDGTGKVYDRYAHVRINGVVINANYLNLIKDAPGLEVAADTQKRVLYFRALDQEGIIMGIHA